MVLRFYKLQNFIDMYFVRIILFKVEHKTYNGAPSFIIGRRLRAINYDRLRAIRLKKFKATEVCMNPNSNSLSIDK